MLSKERRKSAEEQSRLMSMYRIAENEKQNAMLKADAEITESLRHQLAIASNQLQVQMTNNSHSTSNSLERSIESLSGFLILYNKINYNNLNILFFHKRIGQK